MSTKKHILALFLCTCLLSQASCQDKSYSFFDIKTIPNMQNLDSLLTTYTSQPVYYVDYGNRECLFEIRVNDILVERLTQPGTIGGTTNNINQCIFRSGKQKIKIILRPFPGEQLIRNKAPFKLEVGYKDFAIAENNSVPRPWNMVWTLPPVEMPDSGLPIPDIEERVVAEFKRIREMMKKRQFNELEMLLAYKKYDLAKAFYNGSAYIKNSWEEYRLGIESAAPEDWQEIEDYELVFYADGRLVTLESKKKDHYESALLRFRIKERHADHNVLTVNIYDMRLGIRQGTNELIPIR